MYQKLEKMQWKCTLLLLLLLSAPSLLSASRPHPRTHSSKTASDVEISSSSLNNGESGSSIEVNEVIDNDGAQGSQFRGKVSHNWRSGESDNENNGDYDNDDDNDSSSSAVMSAEDQMKLLSKQLNALMNRRKEDYKLLETGLKKYVRNNAASFIDEDVRVEMEKLRQEVKVLREGGATFNKEHLTVQWLSESITELRNEMAELQESMANVTRVVQMQQSVESPAMEEIREMRDDVAKMQLQMRALRSRQDKSDAAVKELRDEATQQAADLRRWLMQQHSGEATALPHTIDYVDPEADHRLRHHRALREQVHQLDAAQAQMRRELSELQHHRLNDRFHAVEIEQRRAAGATFNLSRQVASLEKLHISMLELLEDVAELQTKVDKAIPDLKHEISKMEFSAAQQTSELNLAREEGRNSAKSIQAIAVSMSQLQQQQPVADAAGKLKVLEQQVDKLQHEMEKIRLASAVHKDIAHSRINKIEADSKLNSTTFVLQQTPAELQSASQLVEELEQVEEVYESIVNKLPHDCSQVDVSSSTGEHPKGLYLIAPAGRRPLLVNCDRNWTTIQRRVDGSVDFNRSWNEYARGFGRPAGEYWIGNEILHQLTQDSCMRLRIDIQDIYDNFWFAEYASFRVASRDEGYRLDIGHFSGNASDAMDYQNHMEFSAIDVDRDISNTHCAGNYEGGWWFSHCQHANLNGRYNLGLTWFDATRNEWIAVKSSHMAVTAVSPSECVSYSPPPSNRPPVTPPRQQPTTTTTTSTRQQLA